VHVWHRNEQSPEVAEFTAGRTPTVVGRLDDGTLVELLDAAALDACRGDVERFAAALDGALEEHAARPLDGGPVAEVER
jgi:hypothetical protein